MSRGLAIVLLILTGIIWSTGGFLIKLIPWPPLVIAGLRSGFTAIIIFLYSRPKNFRLVIFGVIGRGALKEYFVVKENPSYEGFS